MLAIEGDSPRLIRHHGQLLRVEMPPGLADEESRWRVNVMKTVATDGTGIFELRARIEAHYAWLAASGELAIREQLRIANTLENIMRAELNRRILSALPATDINRIVEAIRQRTLDPYNAAADLLATL